MNNNVNLRFDMRANDREPITVQEDDEKNDVNQENINRGLTECVEYSSDQNTNEHKQCGRKWYVPRDKP